MCLSLATCYMLTFVFRPSGSFQTVDLSTLTFPNEMHVDYVRVYQREGETNVGCNPTNYPTTDYINNHINAYTSAFLHLSSLAKF